MLKLCKKGSCCPTIDVVGDELHITDDFGNRVRLPSGHTRALAEGLYVAIQNHGLKDDEEVFVKFESNG